MIVLIIGHFATFAKFHKISWRETVGSTDSWSWRHSLYICSPV